MLIEIRAPAHFDRFPLPVTATGTVFGADGSETLYNTLGSVISIMPIPVEFTQVLEPGQIITVGALSTAFTAPSTASGSTISASSSFTPSQISDTVTHIATPTAATASSQHSHIPTTLETHSPNKLSAAAEAGIAIGVIAVAVLTLLGVFFLTRRQRSSAIQTIQRNSSNDNLPEVQVSSEGRPTCFTSLAEKMRYRHHLAELPEDNDLPAEFSAGISVKRKKLNSDLPTLVALVPPIDPISYTPELYRSVDATSLAMPKRPIHASTVSTQSPSELAGPIMKHLPMKPTAEASSIEIGNKNGVQDSMEVLKPPVEAGPVEPLNSFAEQTTSLAGAPFKPSSRSSTAPETSGANKTKPEELARLKETAARLQEKRRRLQKLTEIEDEEAEVRKRIADLEDNNYC
jgi:hypothetical protein